MKKLYGYTRLSQRSDVSISVQKANIRGYCAENSYTLCKIFNEGRNMSGYDSSRPKYQQMLQEIRNNDVDGIAIRDLTRLGRDMPELVRRGADFKETGIEIHSVKEEISLTSPEGFLTYIINAYRADKAKRGEIQKSKEEVQRRLEKGYYHGRPPYGLKFGEEGKYLVPNKNYSSAMEVISQREDRKSYTEIEKSTGINSSKIFRILKRKRLYKGESNKVRFPGNP